MFLRVLTYVYSAVYITFHECSCHPYKPELVWHPLFLALFFINKCATD